MADPQIAQTGHSEPRGHVASDRRREVIRETIQASIDTKQKLSEVGTSGILRMADMIGDSLLRRRKVMIFGNGGSAADAQHFAAELVGRFRRSREPLRVMALTTNTSIITAIGNDFGFDEIFSRQIRAYADKDDIVIAISTSGNSKNVLKAVREATTRGAITIGLTGGAGGELASICDHCIVVPSEDVQRIQECHILISHVVCDLVEQMMI
jgi:D-sedoheptulose 7-phosphate isomerase